MCSLLFCENVAMKDSCWMSKRLGGRSRRIVRVVLKVIGIQMKYKFRVENNGASNTKGIKRGYRIKESELIALSSNGPQN